MCKSRSQPSQTNPKRKKKQAASDFPPPLVRSVGIFASFLVGWLVGSPLVRVRYGARSLFGLMLARLPFCTCRAPSVGFFPLPAPLFFQCVSIEEKMSCSLLPSLACFPSALVSTAPDDERHEPEAPSQAKKRGAPPCCLGPSPTYHPRRAMRHTYKARSTLLAPFPLAASQSAFTLSAAAPRCSCLSSAARSPIISHTLSSPPSSSYSSQAHHPASPLPPPFFPFFL